MFISTDSHFVTSGLLVAQNGIVQSLLLMRYQLGPAERYQLRESDVFRALLAATYQSCFLCFVDYSVDSVVVRGAILAPTSHSRVSARVLIFLDTAVCTYLCKYL